MKLKKILPMLLSVFMIANTVILPVSAKDFSQGLPEGWTQSGVGNASVTPDEEALAIKVVGTKTTAASQTVVTKAENTGENLYLKLDFSVNDAAVEREIDITDGVNTVKIGVINGLLLTFLSGDTCTLEDSVRTSMEINIDKSSMLMSVKKNGSNALSVTLSGDKASEINTLDFENLSVKLYTQIILTKATSVFKLYDLDLRELKEVNISSTPAVDKNVLSKEESSSFEINFGTVVDFSEKNVSLHDNTSDIDIDIDISDSIGKIMVIPQNELEFGHRYSLSVLDVYNFIHTDSYTYTHDFLIAPSDYVLPTVQLSSPTDGTTLFTGDVINIKASGESSTFSKLCIYVNGEEINETSEKTVDMTYKLVSEGEITVSARAYDTYGGYDEKIVVININKNNPPRVNLTQPSDNSSYSVGDSITAVAEASDDDGNVSCVEFYYDDTLIQKVLELPYTCKLTVDASGFHTIKAVAYDVRGLSSVDEVSISAEKTDKVYIFTNDFDGYSGGDAPENMGGVSTENGGTYESGINSDNGTTCFKMTLNDKQSGGGPFVMLKAGAGGKIGMEADVFIPEEGNPGVSFSLRSVGITAVDVSFSGNNGVKLKNGTETTTVPIGRGVWHHFKYEFDTYCNTYDFYWDGKQEASQYKCDSAAMIGTLDQVRLTFNGSSSYMMFDNVEYYKLLTAPFPTGIGYEAEDGTTVLKESIPYDKQTVHIIMNTKLDVNTVTKDTVKLIYDGHEKSFDNVKLSDNGMYIIASVKNPFMSMSSYRVKLDKNIASDNNVYAGADLYYDFNVSNKPFDVKSCQLYVNGNAVENVSMNKGDKLSAKAVISNTGGAESNVVMIITLKKDNRTIAMKSFTNSIISGDNPIESQQISCPENGVSASVYIWNSWEMRVPVSHKIFK